MRVGVPKEIKVHEYRVGLTPASVAELVAAGHQVVVQTGAGNGMDALDSCSALSISAKGALEPGAV